MKKKSLLVSINDFLYKPIFFRDITRKEGFISLIVISTFVICCELLVQYTSRDNISVVGSIFSLIFCFFLIILNRKKMHTLGFTKIKLKETFITLVVLFVFALIVNIKQINMNKVTINDFIFNVMYSLITIGFLEELIFRGYLWPRLVVLFGKHKGTLLCGTLFGTMHLISGYQYDDVQINFVYVFNSISSGIIGQYCFLILYSYAQNIYFPSILHSAPHFFIVERTLGKTLSILKGM